MLRAAKYSSLSSILSPEGKNTHPDLPNRLAEALVILPPRVDPAVTWVFRMLTSKGSCCSQCGSPAHSHTY